MRARSRHTNGRGARWSRIAAAAGLAALVGAGFAWRGASASGLRNVRFDGDRSKTRMVVEFDRSTSARLDSLSAGDRRLVLKFHGVDAASDTGGKGQGLIGSWTLKSGLLTLDLTGEATVKRRFLLPPGDGVAGYRYVLDVASAGPRATSVSRPDAGATPAAQAKKVIVIDAGHGGKDPGAAGGIGREKDLTLSVARGLKARLEAEGRYKVVMTRDADVFVTLAKRVRIARQSHADLFISLHADAAASRGTRGAAVYTLSRQGSDRAARNVFAGGSFMDVDLPGGERAMQQIVLDLKQRETLSQSGAFAEVLLKRISIETALLHRSHRDAGYMVLLAPDVPAVLLELGFLSNSGDASNLDNPTRRANMVRAVGESIDTYFAGQLRTSAR